MVTIILILTGAGVVFSLMVWSYCCGFNDGKSYERTVNSQDNILGL